MSKTNTTASTLLIEILRLAGEAESAVQQYVDTRATPLLQSSFASANIFQLRRQQVPEARVGDDVYLAAFQFEGGDAGAAEERADSLKQSRSDQMTVLDSAVYTKILDFGRPSPAGEAGPRSAMIVFSHATDPIHDALFNQWYSEHHMVDVGMSPHFRSATRYRLRIQGEGTPLPYLCVYEIDYAYTDELYDWMMQWLREDAPDAFKNPMPNTPGGLPVLTLDFWGYWERVWSGVGN